MCCFKLLATLTEEINLMINEFWRGLKKGKRKIHMMKWERLRESKQQRGFRGIKAFILLISQE